MFDKDECKRQIDDCYERSQIARLKQQTLESLVCVIFEAADELPHTDANYKCCLKSMLAIEHAILAYNEAIKEALLTTCEDLSRDNNVDIRLPLEAFS